MTALVRSHSYNLLHDWQTQHHWGNGSSHPELRSNRDYVGQRLGVVGVPESVLRQSYLAKSCPKIPVASNP